MKGEPYEIGRCCSDFTSSCASGWDGETKEMVGSISDCVSGWNGSEIGEIYEIGR